MCSGLVLNSSGQARGSAVKSVLADMLRDSKGSDDRHFIKHTVGAVYSGEW